MTLDEIKTVIELHAKWLRGEEGGVRANFSNVDLSNVDLSNSDLSRANFSYADLSNANFHNAYLSYADLSNANFSNADLSNANFYCAYLSYADLSNVDLRYAKNILQIGPMPPSGRTIYIVNGPVVMIQAGCFWGNVDELEQKIKATHSDPLYLSVAKLIRQKKIFYDA